MPELDLNGYTDIPNGLIANVATFLEMTEPPRHKPAERTDVSLRHVETPELGWYRAMLRRVGEDYLWFARANMDVARLAKIIMFYRAIDGFRYTNMAHRYQAFLDLSHLLAQDDLAILLCRISTTGSRWFDNDEPLGSNQDRHWTYYRFVLPVESQESRVEN